MLRTVLPTAVILAAATVALADVEVAGIRLKEGPQDRVAVTAQEWAWRGGAESYPCISFTLRSGRFTYQIRHDRRSGNGTVGLSLPTGGNWYQSGMLHLKLNGKPFDLLPANGETVSTAEGSKGIVRLAWETEQAKVQYTFVLPAGEDRLYLEIALQPKIDLREIRTDLTNYPSGFNREPQHLLWTPLRTLDKPGRQVLDPAREPAVFLSDLTLDPQTNPAAQGPSALVFDASGVTAASVAPGGYGVGMQLDYRPETRRLLYCFWEYPAVSNAEALQAFRAAYPAALAELLRPETFAK